MLPLILVKIIYYPLTILTLLVTILTFYLGEYSVYYLSKRKITIHNLTIESFTLYSGLLIYIFTPPSAPLYITIILTLLASILKVLLGGFGKYKQNPYLPTIFIMTLIEGYYAINTLNLPPAGPSTYTILLNIMALCSLMYLIYNSSIKYQITLSHLLTFVLLASVVGVVTGTVAGNFVALVNSGLILISMYLASDSVTTPVTTKGQVAYGVGLGIMSVLFMSIFPITFAVLPLIVMQFFTKAIDNYFMTK